jgi:chromosome segregation ATPase
MLRESFEKVSGQNAAATPLSEQFHYLATHLGGMYVRGAFGTEGDKNLATYEGANLDIEGAKKDIARARGRQTDLDINAGNAESDLQSTRQEMQKNKDQVRELEDKITVQTATSKLKEAGAQQDLGLQKANSELVSDRDIAGRVAAGGQVSGDEQQQIMADAAKIAGHNVNLQTAAQIIQNGAENMGIFMNQLGILARSFAQFGPGQMAQFQAQLDEIRAQVGEIARTGSH